MRPHSIRSLLGISAVLVAAVVVALAFGVSTHSPTAQAQAADDDPRLINITNLDQLDAVRYDPDGDGTPSRNVSDYEAAFPDAADRTCADGCTGYELMADLDFEGSDYATGTGWIPIEEFDAIFDGNGYTISNLFIDMDIDGDVNAGLFAELSVGAVIRNLRLAAVDVTVTNVGVGTAGNVRVGGLVGRSVGTVAGIYVSGEISVANAQSSTYVGGLLGASNGTTTASGARVEIIVQGGGGTTNAGGLVGFNSSGLPSTDRERPNPLIRDSYATGHVTVSTSTGHLSHRAQAGGLVGYNDGSIIGSYATGNASAASGYDGTEASPHSVVAGGLAGQNVRFIGASYATGDSTATAAGEYSNACAGGLVGTVAGPSGEDIVASYATGKASATSNVGEEYAGGLTGGAGSIVSVTITASYSTGIARATETGVNVGGLVGSASTTTAPHSYWDVDSSGQDASAIGTGKTTVALQAPTSASPGGIYAAWNVDVDNADGDFDVTTGVDDPWDFGESWQYPVLKYGILDPAKQRAQVTLVLSEASIDEDGGETTVTATQDRTSNLPTEVTLSVPAGSPVTLSENGKLVIPAGETESTGTVKITGVDDSDTMDDRTVVVSGQVAAGGSGADNPDDVELTVGDAMRVMNVRVRPKTTLAVVSWDALEGADGYRVQWTYGGREWSEDRERGASSTATTLRRLRPGTEYTVRVSAANGGAWSVPVTLTTEDPDDEEGLSPFATMTPTPTATPAVPTATPIPPTTMISTSTATTLVSSDGTVTLELPAGSRSEPYQVNFESEDGCSYAGGNADVTFTCVTVLIFDSEDMLEMGVELDAPATLSFHLTAEQVEALGGEFLLATLHELGGLMILTRASADAGWTSVSGTTLTFDDETGGAVLQGWVSNFSSFTVVADQATYDTVQEMYGHLLPRDTLTPPTGGPSLPGVALLALLLGSVALLTAGWIMTARRSGA